MIEKQIIDILTYPQRPNAKIAEITSALAESQRGTDVYYYCLRDGVLFSPTHRIPVIDSTASPKDKRLIEQIQSWATNNHEGTSIWISPPTEAGETGAKITVLEIAGRERKTIKNTSVLVNLSPKELQELIDYTISFSINPLEKLDPEEARYRLIILKEKTIPQNIEHLLNGGWEEQKERIRKAVEIVRIQREKSHIAGVIFANCAGSFPLSCPTIGVRHFPNRSTEIGARFLECTCPFCHLKVKARVEAGKIHCPVCQRSADYHC